MNTSVRFKNLESSEALRTYVSEKLNRLDKYFSGPTEANVVLSIAHSTELANCEQTKRDLPMVVHFNTQKRLLFVKLWGFLAS